MERSLQLSSSDSSMQFEVWSHLETSPYRILSSKKKVLPLPLDSLTIVAFLWDTIFQRICFTSAPCWYTDHRYKWILPLSMWSAWYASPGDMISWCGDMMIWLWYIWYESQSVFSAWSASPETVRLQCGICHPVPRRNPHCEHLWTCVDSTLIMRANLGTERPLEKYWRPYFLDLFCRTTPRRGCWRCNKGQRSDAQGTLAARPLLWCSGTPLNNKIKNPTTLWGSLYARCYLSKMESSQRPLTVTFLTGAGTSQREQNSGTFVKCI